MAKQLGPTFGDELVAAGIPLRLAWGPTDDLISGRENLSAEDNARLDEVIAAHNPALTPVPPEISRRQFYQAAAELGYITQDEAKQAMADPTYALNQLKAKIGALAVEDQFAAEMKLLGAVAVLRYDSLTESYLTSIGVTGKQMDDLFRHAAAL